MSIAKRHRVGFAALSAELEPQMLTNDLDVLVAKRCQAEGLVGVGVLIVTDTDKRRLEQADDRGEHFVPWKPRQREIPFHPRTDLRQNVRKRHDASVLELVSVLPPPLVIAVLSAATRITTDGLNVRVPRRRDPHVRPRRWDRERLDAREDDRIAHDLAVRGAIRERRTSTLARDAGTRVGDIAQPRLAGRLRGRLDGRRDLDFREGRCFGSDHDGSSVPSG